jgi:CBS domain-containing membrane protein
MVLLDVSHPPAGATTLIVSLGIISKPRELLIIEVAVFLLVLRLWSSARYQTNQLAAG